MTDITYRADGVLRSEDATEEDLEDLPKKAVEAAAAGVRWQYCVFSVDEHPADAVRVLVIDDHEAGYMPTAMISAGGDWDWIEVADGTDPETALRKWWAQSEGDEDAECVVETPILSDYDADRITFRYGL